jgi:hypothetical protein
MTRSCAGNQKATTHPTPKGEAVVVSGPNSVPNTTHHNTTILDELFLPTPKGMVYSIQTAMYQQAPILLIFHP